MSPDQWEAYASLVPNPSINTRVTFGLFEVDLIAGELWKAGYRVKLQSQPFKLLAIFLESPGQVFSRAELQERLWGKDSTVDFDHSLGIAINKIREALGDSADNPRFVETLARRGYRFIAPVAPIGGALEEEVVLPAATVAPVIADPVVVLPTQSGLLMSRADRGDSGRFKPLLWVGLAIVAALIGLALYGSKRSAEGPAPIRKVTQNGHMAPSTAYTESLAASVSDGVHLFAPILENGHAGLASITLSNGNVFPLSVPPEVASPAIADISKDGSTLLLREHLSPESEQALWIVPTIGGSAQRVGRVLAHDATWMPDGDDILYASGNDLLLTEKVGNSPQLYASLPGRAFWLRWEPNGRLLRFTIIDPIDHTMSLWQLSPANRKATQVVPHFADPDSECCGVWTADGSSYIFQSSQAGNTDLWRLQGESTSSPARLTNGPLQFEAPIAPRTGNKVYFLGLDARSEMQRFDPRVGMVPERSFLNSAIRLEYSRDGKWVAWTSTAGPLWRARVDGTDALQLTPDSYDVFLARWSPDGSRLAFMSREPGQAWTLKMVSANGDALHTILQETRNAADPSWSADGQTLVFGRVNDVMGKESGPRTLSLLNLRTNAVSTLPGSEGLFSPRWSPDGRYIAALSLDQRTVHLLDVTARTWTTLPVRSGADPVWSTDSRSLYLLAALDPGQPIDRVSIPDGHVEEIVRLADSPASDAVDYIFGGLTLANQPLVRARVFTGNIYSLDLLR